jgi:hypothetical protein
MINPMIKIKETIWEHEEVVRLRHQFSELDSKTQTYIIFGGFGAFAVLMLGLLGVLMTSVHVVKRDMAEINESIHYLNSSSEKMDQLNQQINSQSTTVDDLDLNSASPLQEVVEKVAGRSAIGKDSLELPAVTTAPTFEVKLNKISLRQLVRFLFYVENSKAEASFSQVLVDTKNNAEGYLWATLKLVREAKGKRK